MCTKAFLYVDPDHSTLINMKTMNSIMINTTLSLTVDITTQTYKTLVLRLTRHTFVPTHSHSTLVRLYVLLVSLQLLYCTQVWHPHLMKYIVNFKRIQRRATKHISNDYTSCYKDHLINLRLKVQLLLTIVKFKIGRWRFC